MNQEQLYQWVETISKGWKGFSRYFQANVGHFTRGVVRCRSCRVRAIVGYVGGKAASQRRRLQRFVSQDVPGIDPKEWTECLGEN